MTKGGVGERGKVHWLRFFTQKKKKTFVSAWDQLLKLVGNPLILVIVINVRNTLVVTLVVVRGMYFLS